jgi:hypothetical protein
MFARWDRDADPVPVVGHGAHHLSRLLLGPIGRRQSIATLESRVEEISDLADAIRQKPSHEQDAVVLRRLVDLRRRQQRAAELLFAFRTVCEKESRPRVASMRLLFRGLAEQVRQALGGLVVVRGVGDADMAVIEDRLVRSVRLQTVRGGGEVAL